jgi:hypothetical protein
VLVTDSFAPGGTDLLNADDFGFDFEPGYDVSLMRHSVLGTCWDIEGRYFGVDGWDSSVPTITSPNGGVIQFVEPIGNVFFPAEINASYNSELHSAELNARRQVRNWLQFLVGVRYLELNEQSLTITQDIGPGLNLATTDNSAVNRLWGAQLGADALLLQRNRFSVEGIMKAGIFANSASNSTSISQPTGPFFNSAAQTDHTAFVGEVGVTGLYQFTSCLSVRASYQMLWLEGTALASDQISVSDPANGVATVDTGGSLFYHGVFVGLQLDL